MNRQLLSKAVTMPFLFSIRLLLVSKIFPTKSSTLVGSKLDFGLTTNRALCNPPLSTALFKSLRAPAAKISSR